MERKCAVRWTDTGRQGSCWLAGAAVLLVLLVLLAVDMFSGGAAAVPASMRCDAWAELEREDDGRMMLRFGMDGGRTVDTLGVLTLRVYASEDGQSWSLDRTMTAREEPLLMTTQSSAHQGTVELAGTPGRYYRACLVFWAGDEEQSRTRNIWTGEVCA